MRKFTLVLALAISLAGLVVLGSAGAATKAAPKGAAGKGASTKLSIRSYPGGVFGYVNSPAAATCSSDRKVIVYEQVGEQRDPQSDPRVSSDLAEASEPSFLWTVKTGRSGQFYARAAAIKGCDEALSGTVESQTPVLETAGTNNKYPTCGPYISEGTSEICWLGQLHLDLDQEGPFNPCRFGTGSGSCPGDGSGAPYPWGASLFGNSSYSQVYWKPEGSVRSFVAVAFRDNKREGDGVAHLGGTLPSSNSDRFTVTDGFAQNDTGYPNGDHFFTPDLPGQGPGEVGGPLRFNWENGSGTHYGSNVWIDGYLYLKH
jgi:hypothetical protein